MPITTASLPALIWRRASNGSVTIRQPALARPAVLGVDVVLQLAQPPRLQAHAVHLVAGVALVRIERAEHLVVDEQVHHQPQPGAIGALEPAVVGLLVGQRGVVRPVLERRPAARVVRADRVAVREHVLADRAGAVGLVVGAVDERARDAVRMPRAPAVDAAAEELEGHHVHVGVEQAAHLAERRGAAGRLAARRWSRPRGSRRSPSAGSNAKRVATLPRTSRPSCTPSAPVAQAQHVAPSDRSSSRPTRSAPPGSGRARARSAAGRGRSRGSRARSRRAGSGRAPSPAAGSARPERRAGSRRRRSWRPGSRRWSGRSSRRPGRSDPAPPRRRGEQDGEQHPQRDPCAPRRRRYPPRAARCAGFRTGGRRPARPRAPRRAQPASSGLRLRRRPGGR